MAGNQRVGGIFALQVNGETFKAKGAWTYNLGKPKAESVIGADSVHGFKETPQEAFMEGEITDDGSIDLAKLVATRDATVTMGLGNGKTVALHKARWAGEGTASSEEGQISAKFIGESADEIS